MMPKSILMKMLMAMVVRTIDNCADGDKDEDAADDKGGDAEASDDVDEDEGIVELDMTVKNTKDETRVFGTAKVRLPLS